MTVNRRVAAGAVGACLVLALTAPALAQPQDAAALDAKCVAFAGLLQAQADPKMKEAGQVLSMFFMGRISSRGRPVDLDKAMVDVQPEIVGGIGPLRDKCGAVIGATQSLLVSATREKAGPGAPAAPAKK